MAFFKARFSARALKDMFVAAFLSATDASAALPGSTRALPCPCQGTSCCKRQASFADADQSLFRARKIGVGVAKRFCHPKLVMYDSNEEDFVMAWSKPTIREIECGMEINMYGPDFDDDRDVLF